MGNGFCFLSCGLCFGTLILEDGFCKLVLMLTFRFGYLGFVFEFASALGFCFGILDFDVGFRFWHGFRIMNLLWVWIWDLFAFG